MNSVGKKSDFFLERLGRSRTSTAVAEGASRAFFCLRWAPPSQLFLGGGVHLTGSFNAGLRLKGSAFTTEPVSLWAPPS